MPACRIGSLILLVAIFLVDEKAFSESSDTPRNSIAAADFLRAHILILKGDEAELIGNKEVALKYYRESARIYQESASRNPGSSGIWRKLGYYYLLGDQKDQATTAFKEAIRQRPDDADSRRMLDIIQAMPIINAIQMSNDPKAPATEQDVMRDFIYWINKVDDWRTAIDLHAPGEPDASAAAIGFLPQFDLEVIAFFPKILKEIRLRKEKIPKDAKRIDLKNAANDAANNIADSAAVSGHVLSPAARITISQRIRLQRMQSLKKEAAEQSHNMSPALAALGLALDIEPFLRLTKKFNQILKRGALLHSDIALLQLEKGRVEGFYGPYSSHKGRTDSSYQDQSPGKIQRPVYRHVS